MGKKSNGKDNKGSEPNRHDRRGLDWSQARIRHDTGKHKQVKFRYDPLVRTEFDFKGWKHERDSDAVRSILPEDIMVSSEGNMFVVGKDNRYNLKQFVNQHPQHVRSYRLDRIQID